jgi:hypothetical protein
MGKKIFSTEAKEKKAEHPEYYNNFSCVNPNKKIAKGTEKKEVSILGLMEDNLKKAGRDGEAGPHESRMPLFSTSSNKNSSSLVLSPDKDHKKLNIMSQEVSLHELK